MGGEDGGGAVDLLVRMEGGVVLGMVGEVLPGRVVVAAGVDVVADAAVVGELLSGFGVDVACEAAGTVAMGTGVAIDASGTVGLESVFIVI